VVSRTNLIDGVWGDRSVDGNVLEACVRRLRSKLGDQAIETVRNAGYRVARA
jgi:DNA-binding winged helix-turn-helix (wHTH) protein